jgi:hypothetical protein
MQYRLNKSQLLEILVNWNRYLRRPVHLIACGGTAMTLLGVKASTKDVDFMVPDVGEHRYLTAQLTSLGYEPVSGSGWQRRGEPFRFDLFSGNRIHTTELLETPLLEGRNRPLARYSRLYVGILNDDDLIASKLMRGTQVDFEDCVMLFEAHRGEIDIERLREHFRGLIQYDVNPERLRPHFDHFHRLLEEKGLS